MTRQMFLIVLAVVCAIAMLGLAETAVAQQGQPTFEQRSAGAPPTLPMTRPTLRDLTPEERERLKKMTGSETISWSEFLTQWMTPRPVPKSSVVMIDDTYGYPHIAVSFKMEVVDPPEGEEADPDVVWMRGIPPEDPNSPLHKMWEQRQAREIFFKMQQEWEDEHGENDYFVDFGAEPVPAPFMDILSLEPAFEGLPGDGRWQMNFDVADMNGDGEIDLVFPPRRKGAAQPLIVLGAGDGTFKRWENTRWPSKIPFDYGGIATGDFNGDGHMDITLAIHFKGQYAFLGDGKGDFTHSAVLPSPDPRISSRAPAVADFDGDGLDDIALLAEIDYDLATNSRIGSTPTLWIVYSTGKSWRLPEQHIVAGVIGDNLDAADVNQDGKPDLILSSNATNFRKLLFFNRGDGNWERSDYLGVLSNALHTDVVADEKSNSLYGVFVQFLYTGEDNLARTGLVRYTVDEGGLGEKGTPLYFDDQRFDPYFRIAAGDLDNDGRTDIVAGRKGGSLEVFMQTEDGKFYQEVGPELSKERGTPFDIKLLDINHDDRDDIVATFADKDERKGGVRIWLSKPKPE